MIFIKLPMHVTGPVRPKYAYWLSAQHLVFPRRQLEDKPGTQKRVTESELPTNDIIDKFAACGSRKLKFSFPL